MKLLEEKDRLAWDAGVSFGYLLLLLFWWVIPLLRSLTRIVDGWRK